MAEQLTGPVSGSEPRRLVFVRTTAQLEALRASAPALLEGSQVVGLSPLLSLGEAAACLGRAFFPYTDFLSEADFSAAEVEAQEVSRTWFAAPAGDAGDPDLVESVRLEVLQTLHEIVLARRVLAGALDALRPAEVVLAPGLDLRVTAVAEYEAAERGIPVLKAGPGSAGRARHFLRASPRAEASKLARLLRQALSNAWLLARHWLRQRFDPRPVVMAFGSGVDSVNQQRLLARVEAGAGLRAILLRAGESDSTMHNRPGRSDHPVLHFLPWNAMARAGRTLPTCRRWLQAFRADQACYEGPHAYLFSNSRFAPYFERLYLHLLPHALATREDARLWLRRLSPGLVLTGNDVSFPVRTLVLEARKAGIPTLGLIHSGLNNMVYRDFASDRMAVWGEVHARDFVRLLGKERSSLAPIGNPQYDTLGLRGEEHADAGPGRAPRVAVLTAVAHWQMLYYNQREHLRAWRELERLPEGGVHVIVKPHPRFDDYAFYSTLRGARPDWREDRPGISLARHAFLEEVVQECDLVVVPNMPTTGAVEAMLLRKPVVYLMCGFQEVDSCTSIADGCLVVRSVEEIRSAILGLLGSRERREELVRRGDCYLDLLLGPRDRQATGRLVALMAGMARRGPRACVPYAARREAHR